MIATWMLYTIVTSALIAIGALAIDRIALSLRRPMRWLWMSAMIAAVLWPLVAMLLSRSTPQTASTVSAGLHQASAIIVRASERALHISADSLLVGFWSLLSLLLVVRLARGVMALNARRRHWTRATVGDSRVLVSSDTGPAVIGFDPMEVVLPSWALSLDEPLRALVLRHEEEHRHARDPYLLVASAALVVAMPWNPALVWMSKRLRLAIELDCDARVLRAHPHQERYGMLLLAIAQRVSGRSGLFAPAMSEPALNLARRLSAMRISTPPSRARLATLGVVGAAAIAVACSIDAPTEPANARAAYERHVSLTGERAPEPEREQASSDTGFAVYRFLNTDSGMVTIYRKNGTGEMREVPGKAIAEIGMTAPYEQVQEILRNGKRVAYPSEERRGEPMRAEARIDHRGPEREVAPVTELGVMTRTREGLATTERKAPEPERERPIVEQGTMGEQGTTAPRSLQSQEATYYDFQVEKPATQVRGTGIPSYPVALRDAGIEGEVDVSLVVETDGRVSAFEVLRSPHQLFTDAVLEAVKTMRFYPARVGGHPVRQLVQLPFVFSIK